MNVSARGTVLIVLAVAVMVGSYMVLSRGIRNKNPTNIRHGDNWQGMAKVQTDKSFVQFTHVKYGVRTAAKVLDSYARRGVVYLGEIIATWAPPSENDTLAYLEHVEKLTGLWSNQVITREEYPALIAAIIAHENGFNPYSEKLIKEGIALA